MTFATNLPQPIWGLTGASAGFDIFTPAADATYYMIIRGQDVASGTPSNGFVDILTVFGAVTVTWTVLSSTTIVGTPGARTYSNNSGALKVALASGTTWYIDALYFRFPY